MSSLAHAADPTASALPRRRCEARGCHRDGARPVRVRLPGWRVSETRDLCPDHQRLVEGRATPTLTRGMPPEPKMSEPFPDPTSTPAPAPADAIILQEVDHALLSPPDPETAKTWAEAEAAWEASAETGYNVSALVAVQTLCHRLACSQRSAAVDRAARAALQAVGHALTAAGSPACDDYAGGVRWLLRARDVALADLAETQARATAREQELLSKLAMATAAEARLSVALDEARDASEREGYSAAVKDFAHLLTGDTGLRLAVCRRLIPTRALAGLLCAETVSPARALLLSHALLPTPTR